MRAFSAGLSVILGLSVCYLAACSSDSDAGGGAAGEAGETSSAGASGKGGTGKGGSGSSGAPGAAGDTTGVAGDMTGAAGAAGASSCAFDSDACTSCLSAKCLGELTACASATDCADALDKLEPCACSSNMTPVMCETAFTGDGGDAAPPLVTCFNAHCASVCTQ